MRDLESQWLERDIYLEVLADSFGKRRYWGTDLEEAALEEAILRVWARNRYKNI